MIACCNGKKLFSKYLLKVILVSTSYVVKYQLPKKVAFVT